MSDPDAVSRLSLRNISKSFGATAALKGVSLDIRSGETIALLGENGAGKSTLMKVISGACIPDSGTMLLDGKPYHPTDPLTARRCGIAMMYQELSLAPDLTVAENIFLGRESARHGLLNRAAMRAAARDALSRLGHREIDVNAAVRTLSMSERQIVEISRVFVSEARVLILDEPTSSLSRPDVEKLFALIRRLEARGLAVIYISHFLPEIFSVAERYAVMRDGELVGEGRTKETTPAALAALLSGGSELERETGLALEPGAVLLRARSIRGEEKPVSASIEVRRGEIVGIAGLVGSGRTEFLRAIFGLDPLAEGEVTIGSHDLGSGTAVRWLYGAGYVSEDRGGEGLCLTRSIADNIMLSALARPDAERRISLSRLQDQCDRIARLLTVKCRDLRQPVGALSGGNQQKVAVARLLHHDVDLFILDEPTRGIDIRSRFELFEVLRRLVHEQDRPEARKGALLVSSSFPELLSVCDRIAVMHRGVLGEALPAERWTEQQLILASSGAEQM